MMRRRKQFAAIAAAVILCLNTGVSAFAQEDIQTPAESTVETVAVDELQEDEPVTGAADETTTDETTDEVADETTDDTAADETTDVAPEEEIVDETTDEVADETTDVASEEETVDETTDELAADLGSAEAAEISLEEEGAPVAEEAAKTKLPTPTGVQWTDNWVLQWNVVPEAHGFYQLEIYKDGALYFNTNWSFGEPTTDTIRVDHLTEITEGGTYTFRVAAANNYDWETLENSDFSAMSAEKVYTRPAQVLGTTVATWDSSQEGWYTYPSVEGAAGYKKSLYKQNEDGTWYRKTSVWSINQSWTDSAGNVRRDSFVSDIVEEGRYCITVQALSNNIDAIAHGEEGAKSEVFDTAMSADAVSGKLDEVLAGDPVVGRDTISAMGLDTLRTAMQTNDETVGKMKKLEEQYMQSKGITAAANTVSEDAKQYVDAGRINMVGAGLNVDSGSVNLAVAVPEKKVEVPTNRYKNSVQLDIKLMNDSQATGKLLVPITITMPIPTGVWAGQLTILHYHADGTSEVINPRVNTDGTITFTVTSFSTFVFANEAEDEVTAPTEEQHYHNYGELMVEPTATTWGYTTHYCACGATYYDNYVAPTGANAAGTALTSPQTGESDMPVVIFMAALAAAGVAFYMRKKVNA